MSSLQPLSPPGKVSSWDCLQFRKPEVVYRKPEGESTAAGGDAEAYSSPVHTAAHVSPEPQSFSLGFSLVLNCEGDRPRVSRVTGDGRPGTGAALFQCHML